MAADQGNEDAIVQLGLMAVCGQGGVNDDAQVIERIKTLAESGQADSQIILAAFLIEESEETGNYSEPLKWLRKSVKQGNKIAQFCMGYLHKEGEVLTLDKVKAHMWLSLSNAEPDDVIDEQISELEKSMTLDQVSLAEELMIKEQTIIH